jgi:CheY-like chemotaxis protein
MPLTPITAATLAPGSTRALGCSQRCPRRSAFGFRPLDSGFNSFWRFVLIVAFLCGAAGGSAQEINGLRRENVMRREDGSLPDAEEIARWTTEHAKQVAEKQRKRQLYRKQREQVRKSLGHLVEAGQSYQTNFVQPAAPTASPNEEERAQARDELLLIGLFLFLVVLASLTRRRHRREAEIRKLKGDYLSDGLEAATLRMPEWFAQPLPNTNEPPLELPEAQPDRAQRKHLLDEFFAEAPEYLNRIRNTLPEVGRAVEAAEKQKCFMAMAEQIGLLKNKADRWDLRPVWQLTSALELLVKRLADKCKEATPSTLRTVAHAVDLLGEIAVPGIRPDLIINPPISVLAVDDDPLCLRAVVFALQKADITPEIAADGERAVALAGEKYYDVIFMDIQMPGIDGLQASARIRETKKNQTTPIVFVTVQSDFHTRAKSSLMGGTDLMAKPFLMFEITVKALMLAMRKRLQLVASCEREIGGYAQPVAAEAVHPAPSVALAQPPAAEEVKAAA